MPSKADCGHEATAVAWGHIGGAFAWSTCQGSGLLSSLCFCLKEHFSFTFLMPLDLEP